MYMYGKIPVIPANHTATPTKRSHAHALTLKTIINDSLHIMQPSQSVTTEGVKRCPWMVDPSLCVFLLPSFPRLAWVLPFAPESCDDPCPT